MRTIIRKKTDSVVAADVPIEQLEAVLSGLPTGVYGIEDAGGSECDLALVRGGYVDFRACTV